MAMYNPRFASEDGVINAWSHILGEKPVLVPVIHEDYRNREYKPFVRFALESEYEKASNEGYVALFDNDGISMEKKKLISFPHGSRWVPVADEDITKAEAMLLGEQQGIYWMDINFLSRDYPARKFEILLDDDLEYVLKGKSGIGAVVEAFIYVEQKFVEYFGKFQGWDRIHHRAFLALKDPRPFQIDGADGEKLDLIQFLQKEVLKDGQKYGLFLAPKGAIHRYITLEAGSIEINETKEPAFVAEIRLCD